ncbi:MAG: hypothetical protein U9N40_03810 [Euryarchaeota archaeon]|nr:hypothetical protein [Euryarchaeota archaeon]
MRLSSFIIVALMLLAAATFVSPVSADAPPAFPHAFSGDVLVNGIPAPDGYKVSATVSEGEVVTDEQNPVTTIGGSYGKGGTLFLLVQGDIPVGATINFYVNGVKASNTAVYQPGNTDSMNLSVSITPPTPHPHGGGGGGGAGLPPPTPVKEFKTTGTVTTNSDGIVQETIKVLTADEKAYFSIPEGIKALDANGLPLKEAIIQATDDISAPASGFTFAGHAIDASPAGVTFDPAITLTFQLTEEEWANLPAGETYTVRWFNAGTDAWENVPTYVNPTTHRVIAKVSHFSTFAVFMQEAGVVEPTPVTTGVPVTTTPVGTETTPVAPEPPGEFPWTMVIGIIVVLAIIGAGYWYYTNQD